MLRLLCTVIALLCTCHMLVLDHAQEMLGHLQLWLTCALGLEVGVHVLACVYVQCNAKCLRSAMCAAQVQAMETSVGSVK